MDVEKRLQSSTSTVKLVGFRTTKACASSSEIKSIQLIYMSTEAFICEIVLDRILEDENQDFDQNA